MREYEYCLDTYPLYVQIDTHKSEKKNLAGWRWVSW